MKSGTRPMKYAPRRKFHVHFGGVLPTQVPDFNLDKGIWMPDQNADQAETECTGYWPADLVTDITGIIQTPDFSYAVNLWIENVVPNTGGADIHSGAKGLVIRGTLPAALANFSAKTMGELYVANIKNWSQAQSIAALKNVQRGVYDALGFGDPFDSIVSAMLKGKLSVSLGSPWWPEWESVGADGILPMPKDTSNLSAVPWHNYGAKKRITINGKPMIGVKSWQGPNYGDKGWAYMTPEVANTVFSIPGTGAIAVSLDVSRFITMVQIMMSDIRTIPRYLPYLQV